MARRKTRTHHAEPAKPARASYAELREAARMRRAARAARTAAQDTPRRAAGPTAQPPDQEAGRGISRRDFVSAGAAAVVAAAAPPALFAQTTTPQAALDLCMTEMKKATTLPMGTGVEAWLRQHALDNFINHIADFDKNKDKVLEASRAIGTIASTLAGLNSRTIEKRHMHDAVAAVKPNCTVGTPQPRFVFCPDLPT